jgi:hypothetical protein
MSRALLFVFALAAFAASDAHAVKEGDSVLAYWAKVEHHFVGTAVQADGKAGWLVVFEDGDSAVIPTAQIRPNDIKVGTKVKARWKDGKFYSGTVGKIVGRALFINYDDGDTGWAPWSWIAVK